MVKLVARSGCIGIFVGIETATGSYANLPKNNGGSAAADLIRRVRDEGIVLEASLIFGFDDHDESIFDRTLRFLEDCSPGIATFNVLTPYPGTALFKQFEEEGRIIHRNWRQYDHSQVVFRPRLMTPERLYRGWLEARQEVYRWPSIFSRVLSSPKGRFTTLGYNLLRRGGNLSAAELAALAAYSSPALCQTAFSGGPKG